MPDYNSIPIKAITEKATREARNIGIDLNDIARILQESYDCSKGKRKEGIEERCARHKNKILKIAIELKVSKSGFQYWRIRHIDFVG